MPLQAERILRTFRYAMYFDGVDDYVEVSNNFALYDLMNWTVMAWVAPFFVAAPGFYPQIFHPLPGGEMSLVPYAEGVHLTDGNWYGTSTYTGPSMVFTHVAGGRYNGTSLLLYVNGNLVETASIPDYDLVNPSGYCSSIGATNSCGNDQFFTGYIYNVLVYNFALSQSQIQYNMMVPDNPIREGLLLWLQADPAYISGSTWYDLSGNNNNGTIYGATLVELTPSHARQLQAERVLSPVR